MKTKSFIDLRFFSTGVMGNSVELLFKQCYSLLEGFAWSKQNSYWWSLHPRQWRQHWLQHYNCLFCFSPSWKYISSILIVLNSTFWFWFVLNTWLVNIILKIEQTHSSLEIFFLLEYWNVILFFQSSSYYFLLYWTSLPTLQYH